VLDPAVAQVLAALPSPPPDTAPPTLEERRQGYEQVRSLQGTARELEDIRNLVAVHDGTRVPVRLYRPPSSRGPGNGQEAVLPLLVFAHGGAWILGSLDLVDVPARELAVRGQVAVLTVGYRLAPEHPYPAALDDVLAATAWAVAHADELGVDPARVAVGGESAGGTSQPQPLYAPATSTAPPWRCSC
jgi:acetyl esterase